MYTFPDPPAGSPPAQHLDVCLHAAVSCGRGCGCSQADLSGHQEEKGHQSQDFKLYFYHVETFMILELLVVKIDTHIGQYVLMNGPVDKKRKLIDEFIDMIFAIPMLLGAYNQTKKLPIILIDILFVPKPL